MSRFGVVNGSECGFVGELESSCVVEMGSLGPLDIHSSLYPCLSPTELTIHIGMGSLGGWRLNFLAGNPEESRQVGPSFWPLWLKVNFRKLTQHTYSLQGCLEAVKTGESLCFLNEDLTLPPCPMTSRAQQSTVAISIIAVMLAILLLTMVVSFLIWYRRIKRWKQYRRHVNATSSSTSDNSANESFSTATPPLLPGAAKFCDSLKDQQDPSQRETLLRNPDHEDSLWKAKQRSWVDISEVKEDESLFSSFSPNRTTGKYNLYSLRESKLIQTSLTILDATRLLSPSASSNEDDHSGGSRTTHQDKLSGSFGLHSDSDHAGKSNDDKIGEELIEHKSPSSPDRETHSESPI